MSTNKVCPVCEIPIKGRVDKVYCSANCKSAHQYEQKQEKEKFYLEVDKQLKTNRRLLKKYNRTGMTTLRREVLHQEGFDPHFFTHYWKTQKGEVYLFCFDFGFLKLKENKGEVTKEKYLIVEWQDYMKASS